MDTLTRPKTTQIVGDAQAIPECETIAEALETSSNDVRLDHSLVDQVFVSDGKGGYYVQPDRMLRDQLYSFMIDDIWMAVMKQADGNITLYGISVE